jgi:hypothetical protein
MHVGARREIGPPLLPTGLGVAAQADFVARLADDVRRHRAVGIEQFFVVGDLDRFPCLDRALDRGEPRAGGRRPAEIPGPKLLLALLKIVSGHVAQEAVGFQNARFAPPCFVIVAVEVVVAAGRKAALPVAHPAIVAFAFPVVFRRPAARMARPARRREECERRQVDGGGRLVLLWRQVAIERGGRTPVSAEIAGRRGPEATSSLLRGGLFAHALHEMVSLGNLLVVVASAAGLLRRVGLVCVLVLNGVDHVSVFVPQMKRRADSGRWRGCLRPVHSLCRQFAGGLRRRDFNKYQRH